MTEVNIIKENKDKLKTSRRSDLIEEHLKAVFVNKQIHIFSANTSTKGKCVDIVQGQFCIIDAEYELFSSYSSDIITKGESSFMMIPKSGKNIAIISD